MKILRLLLFCLGILLWTEGIHSQELKVVAFQRMDRDLLARTQERLDLNDVPCAIVRVSVANAKEFTFEGNSNIVPKKSTKKMNIKISYDNIAELKKDLSAVKDAMPGMSGPTISEIYGNES